MSTVRAAASIINLSEVLPPATAAQVRRNLHAGIVLRWILVGVIAAGSMLTPSVAGLILYVIAASVAYNGIATVVIARAPAAWHGRIALAVTIVDHLFCFTFLGIYASHVAGSQPLGGYAMGTIEAVFFFGAAGALLSLGIFVVCAVAAQALSLPLFGTTFNGGGLVNSVLMLGMIAVCLVVAFRIRLVAEDKAAGAEIVRLVPGDAEPAVRLSRREHEVLRLVAEGYSNTMIASRLRLSDSTVKGYVENLLFHLNARNRAEAVAAASRLKLL